jgi:hypothetical protein
MTEQQTAEQAEDFGSETDMVDTGQSQPEPKPKPAKKDEQGPNEIKNAVAEAFIDAVADMIREWDPKAHGGISKKIAATVAGSYASYASGDYWRKELVLPDTNRASKHTRTKK